jgi:hypothetical protein
MKNIILIGIFTLFFLAGCMLQNETTNLEEVGQITFVEKTIIHDDSIQIECPSNGILWEDYMDCYKPKCARLESNSIEWISCSKECMNKKIVE